MARKPQRGHRALFPHQQEPREAEAQPVDDDGNLIPTPDAPDSSAEVTTEPTEESIEIPVFPCSSQLTKISSEWAIVRHTDIKTSAMFSLDRHQLIELGSAMLKCGQSMPSPKQIEKAAKRAGETVRDSGLVVPT